jgi:hypothetical protein
MTVTSTARLAEIELPEFGMPEAAPILSEPAYRTRLERLRAAMEERDLDRLVVYMPIASTAPTWRT